MIEMWKFIQKQLNYHADAIISEYTTKEYYTYKTLVDEIENIVIKSMLPSLEGVKCAILCRKSIETVKALLFCWRTGMVAIPLSLHYGKEHCSNIINHTKPHVIISDDLSLCQEYDDIMAVTLDKVDLLFGLQWIKEDVLEGVEIMMCTSGTTGSPKAIMFTARAIQTNVKSIAEYFCVDDNDTVLICRPIYHCAVLVGELLLSIYVGANILLYSEGYNPLLLTNLLERESVTVLCGTPTIFKGIADCLRHRNMRGNLKTVAISGEYLLPEYAHTIRECFPTTKIFNVYGLTEAGPRVTYLPYQMFDEIPQAVGKTLSGVNVKVVTNNQVEHNNIGKVWIKTPSIMKGYYHDLEKMAEKFDEDWFDTGDVGIIDSNNILYILGRSDDMIIKGGMNIYPQEVENKILTLQEIKDVLVYGQFFEGVEHIVAEVVLQEKYDFLKSYDILQKMLLVLPGYMMPNKVLIVEKLPRNASGKVVRLAKKVRSI